MKIDNTNYLTLSGDSKQIKIAKGSAYLYLVKKLENGMTGARHEVMQFNAGEICPNIAETELFAFILCGNNDTEIEFTELSSSETEKFSKLAQEIRQREIEKFENEAKFDEKTSIEQQRKSSANFSNTLYSISSIIKPNQKEYSNFSPDDQHLVRVFKIIGKRMNFEVRALSGRDYKATKAGVNLLAKDNTVRVREVALRNKWFSQDNGDLIAFYNPEGEINLENHSIDEEKGLVPVALIRMNNHYLLIDSENQKQIRVTKENAAQIYPIAFMAYRAIQEDKITIKTIINFVFTHIKADILRYAIIGLFCTLIGLITPAITKNFIDQVIPQAAKNTAIQICIIVFMTNIASMIGSIAKYFANLRMETRADSDLQAAIIDRLLKMPVDFFKQFSAGDLSARVLAIGSIQKKIFDIALSCFTNFIFSFIYLIQEFRYCGYFAKWGILFCLFPLLISVLYSLLTYKWQKMIVESQGKIQGMMLQTLNGIEKINVSNSHKSFFSSWVDVFLKQARISVRLLNITNIISIFTGIFPVIVNILFYLLYGYAVSSKKIEGLTTGSFMAFLSAYSSFQGAFLGMSNSLLSIKDIFPLYKRVKPVLEQEPEVDGHKPSISKIDGEIEVSHLNFRYYPDGPLVLKDINMNVKPGEFVAVVGTSGAGKSTLLRMLLGFEKPESGSIFFDETDINSIDIGSLRRQMGVVLQNDTVMSGTILQNIVGSSGLKEEDAWEAVKKVAFDQDVENMPMGMQTMVPAGGTTLSGGQLQRLIIARALIKNPSVLIFDEATSALDNITQDVVRKSLDELKITRIIIAHRLSTIINADRIYVLHNGEVVETGTYESLMKDDGYFAQLARRQNL